MLNRLPHSVPVLDELHPILVELSDLQSCAKIFQAAFEHYTVTFPSGRGVDPVSGDDVPGGGFGLMHVLVLADLDNTLGEYLRAADTIRKGCRWLQGRAAQKFWDACEDDREWDVPEGGVLRGGDGELPPGMYPLDVNARHRLAIARIKGGDVEEGKVGTVHCVFRRSVRSFAFQMHAKIILSQDVAEYAPLFSEIADAYFEKEIYAEAGHIYEMLGGDAGVCSVAIWFKIAVTIG